MAIRSGLPWPVRWLLAAVVLGLSAAVALWAFEFGREMAGLDPLDTQALTQLREDNERLRSELASASAVANTADSLLTAERAAQASLMAQIRQLENDNQVLKSELGFFEQLLRPSGGADVSVRGLQVRQPSPVVVTWRVMLVQAAKNPVAFKGGLEVTYRGTLRGAPWVVTEPASQHPINLTQYLKMEGRSNLPAGAVVKNISVRVMQGATVKSVLSAQVSG